MTCPPRAAEAWTTPRRATLSGRGIPAFAATAALACCLAWLGWEGARTREEVRLAAQRAVKVAELRGGIAHLGERLTMSARLAALSGDARWVELYDEAGPKLDAAIAEAGALATPESRAALARTTDEAHRDLVMMQRAAMRLAAAGERDAARALLDGPEFAYLGEVYASGIEVFGQELEALAAARAAGLHDRAWMEMVGLALGAVLLAAAAVASRGRARLQAALARTEAVARTDALTGLPNRRRLYWELRRALAKAERGGACVALLLVDLDRFKPVNDLHGHAAGDRVLRLAAERLRATARAGDVVARLGGDEFAVVASLDAADRPRPADDAERLARRFIAALERPFELDGGAVAQIGASVGIASAPPGGADADALVHRADVALHRAKAEGRGRAHVFEPGMDAQLQTRALLEADLRRAVADDAIVPHFQPLVELGTGRVVGFEMLARWPHPSRGMVPPSEFIPVAEDAGLIGPMTAGLLRRACRVASEWPADVSVACNVSPLQLADRALPAVVAAALDESGLPAHRLELEITESALVGDLGLARELLDQLKALGVRLALDDFGTGYSSLRHLQALPFDKLKIDAAFVGTMATDAESRKIVAAVIGLGHSLGLPVVAEGIETPETAALLRELGCDVGQGWLFGRPGPAAAAGAPPRPEPAEALSSSPTGGTDAGGPPHRDRRTEAHEAGDAPAP